MARVKILTTLSAIMLLVFFGFKNKAQAADTYDLKAESLTMSSVKCEVNKVCTFTAKVKNLGSQFVLNFPLKSSAVSANRTDSYTSVSPVQGTLINTNDYITFNLSGVYTKVGSSTLSFSVDPAGYLTESNTKNNSVSLAFKVVGYDLAVEAINISPPKPMANQDCYLLVKVKNNSSYNLTDGDGLDSVMVFPDFTVTNASSTQPSASKTINTGGYLYYGYEGRFAASGEKQLSFTIDPKDTLKESDSANNTKTVKAVIYNPTDTDLAIASIVFATSTTRIVAGIPFDITINIKNVGKTFLTDSKGISKDELGHNLADYAYGLYDLIPDAYPTLSLPLNPNGVFHYRFHGALGQSGNLNLTFAINKNRRLTEFNFDNNSTTTPVKVYANQTEADSFTILSKKVNFASSTTAIISWTTDYKTTGIITYNQVSHNLSDNRIEDNNSTTTHVTTIKNLTPGGNYYYSLTAKSGAVEKTEMMNSFVMPEDDRLRLVSGPSVSTSDKDAGISWSTNLISSGQVYYKKKGAVQVNRAGSETALAEHIVEIKGLALGLYDYYLSSTSTPRTNFKTVWSNFEIKASPTSATTTAAQSQPVSSATLVSYPVTNSSLYEKLKGRIILRVESKGEAYYISPKDKRLYFLGRPEDAFPIIRNQAIGMTNLNLEKIPIGLSVLSGADTDNDGLPDALETAIGTNPDKTDTDGDGYGDKAEIASNNSPLAKDKKLVYDNDLILRFKGQILLQVQGRGEAWYIYPADSKRYFLSRPEDAFNLMRQLGLGVSNKDYISLGGK